MQKKREFYLYEDRFMNWYQQLDKKVQEKIDWVFELVKTVPVIPQKYFRYIENTEGLYEIRVEYESNIYRIFCFFDNGNLIILVNGFQKKTQKTPMHEIRLALKLKKQYFSNK